MVELSWPALAEGMAVELDAARADLEALAVHLCLDSVVFERHASVLQQFDALGQVMGEVSTLLRRRDGSAAHALAAIRLDGVRHRLAAEAAHQGE